MTETLWTTRNAGESHAVADVSDQLGEPALLVGGGKPDWIKRPDTGEKVRVLKMVPDTHLTCPNCKQEVAGVVMMCEGDLFVLECPKCRQFVMFRLNASK